MPAKYIIRGTVVNHSSKKAIVGARVEAWDKDLMLDDLVGNADTDKNGRFEIRFSRKTFTEFFLDRNPDLYFKVFRGEQLIANTKNEVTWNSSSPDLNIRIEVDDQPQPNQPGKIIISGTITHNLGNAIPALKVQAVIKTLRDKKTIAETTSNANGKYSLTIDLPGAGTAIVIEAIEKGQKVLAASPALFEPDEDQVVDLIITGDQFKGDSFYVRDDKILQLYWKELNTVPAQKITVDDILFIAGQTRKDAMDIWFYIHARELERETKISAEVFYGWFNENLPTNIDNLASYDNATLVELLKTAVADNYISPEVIRNADQIITQWHNYITQKALQVKPANGASLNTVLSLAVKENSIQEKILLSYVNHTGSTEDFWKNLDKVTNDKEAAGKIQLGLQLSALTGNQPQMIHALYKENQEAGNNTLSKLAMNDKNDWKIYIGKLSKQSDVSVVPDFIKGKTEEERVDQYAAAISANFQSIFPGAAFAGRLVKDTDANNSFVSSKKDLVNFFQDNPDFNPATSRVFSPVDETLQYNFNNISDKNQLVKELQGIQRISSYAAGYDQINAMKKAGFDSATSIVKISKEKFLESTGALFGSQDKALDVYSKAENNHLAAAGLWAHWHPSLHSTAVTPSGPTLSALFGSQDACECEDCTSVFSAAAYYADLLHFLYSRTDVYTELIRRRPDLPFIKLNCENANTPLPYVDLVIELLEKFVLSHKPVPKVGVPDSYQTAWQAADLAANPENLDYESYDELKKAVYPRVLPFNFSLEEIKVYLNHLGIQRQQLMSVFFAGKPEEAFDDFMICMERLNISIQEAKVITAETTGDGSATGGVFNFYGFDKANGFKALTDPANSILIIDAGTWVQVLASRVDVFLQQTSISYKEMLSLLLCDFINPGTTKITIVAKLTDENLNPVSPDTCELHLLELKGLDENDLKKIYRFLRLWRKLGWSMFELDKALKTFSAIDLDRATLKKISQAENTRKALQLSVEEVLACWSDIDTANKYVDFFSNDYPVLPSLYVKLFRNKTVLKDDIDAFPDDPTTLPGTAITADKKSILLAALQINENDYNVLTTGPVAVTTLNLALKNLSALYRYSLFAKKLNFNIEDFLSVKSLIGIADPFKDPLTTFIFLQKAETIKSSGFSITLVKYILKPEFNKDTQVAPADDNISAFLSELRGALRAIKTDTPEKQKNTLAQKFSEKFRITTVASSLLLSTIQNQAGTNAVEDDFWNTNFEATNFLRTYPDPVAPPKENKVIEPVFVRFKDVTIDTLFDNFCKLDKIATFINKLKLTDAEIEFILNNAGFIGCIDFDSLPATAATGDFNAFEILIRLIRARDVLPIGQPLYRDILNVALNSTNLTIQADKQSWIDGITIRTKWDKGMLEKLIGDKTLNNKAGILKKTFPDDFHNGDIILQIKNCITVLNTLGLEPDIIALTIKDDPDDVDHTAAKAIKDAAKAKYNESQWTKIAKPLRDVLREKQRESLVAYVIAHANFKPDPNPAIAKYERWKDSNELYEYLLIDIEMKPISITSRIKQAICSVQLFIDRVLMNLEYANSNPGTALAPAPPLGMAAQQVKEWNTWRKVYRVWEANRKIFLYPENWLEESLRDNKSPFFKTLETSLQQNELNTDNVEDVLHEYLESLDEVARLEVVALKYQWEGATATEEAIDRLHVVARTIAHPSKYFYRTLENCSSDQKEWTAWQKIEIDIDANPILVVFNRKVCLFWLFFSQQTEKAKSFDAGRGPVPQAPVYWKIQIAWSECKKGKWSAKRLSKTYIESEHFSTESNYYYLNTILDDTSFTQGAKSVFVDLINIGAFENFARFERKLIVWNKIASDGTLVIELKSENFKFYSSTKNEANAAFVFNDTNTDPVIDYSYQFPSSGRTAAYTWHNQMMQQANQDDQPFIIQGASGDELPILKTSKQHMFKLMLPADEFEPYDKRFFFQDAKNTFYVEHAIVPFEQTQFMPNNFDLNNFYMPGAFWKGDMDIRQPPPPPDPQDPETYFLKNPKLPDTLIKTLPRKVAVGLQRTSVVNSFNISDI